MTVCCGLLDSTAFRLFNIWIVLSLTVETTILWVGPEYNEDPFYAISDFAYYSYLSTLLIDYLIQVATFIWSIVIYIQVRALLSKDTTLIIGEEATAKLKEKLPKIRIAFSFILAIMMARFVIYTWQRSINLFSTPANY